MSSFDLSKLYIDFTLCPSGEKLTDFFAELGSFSEFTSTKDENIIKIAILTADMESPFLRIRDRKTMMKSIFDFLKMNLETKACQKLYDDIVDYKDAKFLDCFARYLMIYHDIDWTEYQSTKQTHDVLTVDSMRPREKDEDLAKFVDRKDKVRKMLKATGEELKKLEAKIYPDSKAAREVAMNQAKKIHTYAEKYAEPNNFI